MGKRGKNTRKKKEKFLKSSKKPPKKAEKGKKNNNSGIAQSGRSSRVKFCPGATSAEKAN